MRKRNKNLWLGLLALLVLLSGCYSNGHKAVERSQGAQPMPEAEGRVELLLLDAKAEKRMLVENEAALNGELVLCIKENDREILRHHLRNTDGYFYRGGLGMESYAFCTVQEKPERDERSFQVWGGSYGEQPRLVYSGAAYPNLLPSFFVLDSRLLCSMGVRGEVVVLDTMGGTLSNLSKGLQVQLDNPAVKILSSEPFCSVREYGFFAENKDAAYFYILKEGVITRSWPLREKEKLLSAAITEFCFVGGMQTELPTENAPFRDELVIETFAGIQKEIARKQGSYYQIVSDGRSTALALDYTLAAESPLCIIQVKDTAGGVQLTEQPLPKGMKPETTVIYCTQKGNYLLFDTHTGQGYDMTVETLLEEGAAEKPEVPGSGKVNSSEVEALGAAHAQFDKIPGQQTIRLHFWDAQAIPELGGRNGGTVSYSAENDRLDILLVVYVSEGTGAPEGPSLGYSVDLGTEELLALHIADYEGEIQEGCSSEFPFVNSAKLLEWASLLHAEMVVLENDSLSAAGEN